MATLEYLKRALFEEARKLSSPRRSLSDSEYSAGFDILLRGPGQKTYQDFIIPELSYLLAPLKNSTELISVLEIGPGPRSVFGDLPLCLREKIGRYTAFEPNTVLVTKLEEWFDSGDAEGEKAPFPGLEGPPEIHDRAFDPHDNNGSRGKKYDIVLFCHSMYGMQSKHMYIERALEMLKAGGIVAVFHRDGALYIDSLVCHHTAAWPTGVVGVADEDEALDCFATFVAGQTMAEKEEDKAVRAAWRDVCRTLGRREEANPKHLLFTAPEVMVVFNHHATALPELTAHVALVEGEKTVKSREARLHRSAAVARPTGIHEVQHCVRWALNHELGLTVVGGGHSGHCLRPNVVAVDMSEFDDIHVLRAENDIETQEGSVSPLIVVGTGCKTGDIISKIMAAGLTVPLGSRPSVGTGLWLQGGIGHLSRLHGLACDAIVGATLVSVASGEVLYVGCVPSQHRPDNAIRPKNETELLWAIKGAGTNFGIVVSVTFRAHAAPTYATRNWVVPLNDALDAKHVLAKFNKVVARRLERGSSADAYLYGDAGQLHLGITTYDASTTASIATDPKLKDDIWGADEQIKTVDGVGLFETEMYMAGMHGGHGGGKTSSFKRCVLLKEIGDARIAERLVTAVGNRPTPLCYLHLLHGGGAVEDVAAAATAFGCRDWDFACVITGVWPRNQDGTDMAQCVVRWVYEVVADLLPVCSGVYAADLGPDPRDAVLAEKAFGLNGVRLARLKRVMDPHDVLAYAFPLPKAPIPKLIILVTGESCAGKDHCAGVWASAISESESASLSGHTFREKFDARAVSISDTTKREYAAATGADLSRLLSDRIYKEQHRPDLTAFFKDQVQQRPQLPEEHFLALVRSAVDADVLFITEMRDEAPVAAFAHLIPDRRLIEVHVYATEQTRRVRGGDNRAGVTTPNHCPCLVFNNDRSGDEAVVNFAKHQLIPLLHEDMQRLGDMVRSVPDFPRLGIKFRHVLGIAQQQGGLTLCTSLLQSLFTGNWAQINAIVGCEVGGLVFASALASLVDLPLVPIREAGKLPPPTIAAGKMSSYISSMNQNGTEKLMRIEMEEGAVAKGAKVVIVDDVLSTGETLCAVLQLLGEAGISPDNISVMLVAEFPVHRGRHLLWQRGFGAVSIQSLVVFGGH
jgi:adenine phosphoribosyltransferase